MEHDESGSEYDCARCGIHVVWCVPLPPESILCGTCRFIESIEDPETRRQFVEWLDVMRQRDSKGG